MPNDDDKGMVHYAKMKATTLAAERNGDKGEVEALVSAYNVAYQMGWFENHQFEMGAFAESLADQPTIPLFWMHAWDWTEQPPIGHADGVEVEKPKEGLKIAGEMYLDQPGVTPIFRAMKAGAIREWSIGYRILEYRAVENADDDTVTKIVTKAELLEASSVLRGANPETETLKVAGLHTATLRRVARVLGVDEDRLAALVVGTRTPDEIRRLEGLPSIPPVDSATSTDPEAEADDASTEPEPVDDLAEAIREIRAARTGRRMSLIS